MKSCGKGGSICCLLMLLDLSHNILIEVPQESIIGTVGQSVLLPVSYRLQGTFIEQLFIQWNVMNISDAIIIYSINKSSVKSDGIPTRVSGNNTFTHPDYQCRVVFFPENASLLLQNLQLIDSGVYIVTFREFKQSRNVTLSVIPQTIHQRNHSTESTGPNEPQHRSPWFRAGPVAGGCCACLLLLLIVLCYKWQRGACGSKRSRIIKQEMVQNPEEQFMRIIVKPGTIYLNTSEATGTTGSRLEPLTTYATLDFTARVANPDPC
ncbi:uncharacterized protein LOC115093292 isoform X2 [Rhinatrema bivittatum]|uniref:uncharacterized protein LOC115093292 isoform X2 n=1 Tax=Rhinatrema bivittatum TaxID=194408 RepID=UPI00112CC454|nr:uncharacterized protein LOC115093292 isoform X2 [Rhinatrema bivittatum]